MAIYTMDAGKPRLLAPNLQGNPLERMYARERKEIKQMYKDAKLPGQKEAVLTFATRDKQGRIIKTLSGKRKQKLPIPSSFELKARVNAGDGYEGIPVRYSNGYPTEDRGKFFWDEKDLRIVDALSVPESKIDLAWFILKASNYISKGLIVLINKKVIYGDIVENIRDENELRNILFDPSNEVEDILSMAHKLFPENSDINRGASNIEQMSISLHKMIAVKAGIDKKYYSKALAIIKEKTVTQELMEKMPRLAPVGETKYEKENSKKELITEAIKLGIKGAHLYSLEKLVKVIENKKQEVT